MSAELIHSRQFAENFKKIRVNMAAMDAIDIKVGFPKGEKIGNKSKKGSAHPEYQNMGEVAYIAMVNDAKRPFLAAGIAAGARKIKAAQFKAVSDVIDGRSPIDASGMVGEVAVSCVKGYITTGSFLDISAKTKKRKRSTKPLIDTSQMRNSVTFALSKGSK